MIMDRLCGIRRTLCHRPSRFLYNLEDDLLIELENLLDQEEVLCDQKSHSNWISHGDRNTRYFHRRAIARRQRNHVTSQAVFHTFHKSSFVLWTLFPLPMRFIQL
ncbi:hypothetical protein V6N13_056976 [Hibiscus sabdariffa]